MADLYGNDDCQGILLVDASNAFNALNRQVMLHNIRIICPAASVAVTNFYRRAAKLFVHGEVVLSLEGTTQGDPLAMPIYAVALVPLLAALDASTSRVHQIWYADDSAAGGKLRAVRHWWDLLTDLGPHFGYHPNAAKTWLVVKPSSLPEAQEIFSGTGIKITAEGRPYLGAAIGTEEFQRRHFSARLEEWCSQLTVLTEFAKTDPQSALAAFAHGLRHRWTYAMRTTPDDIADFEALECVIAQEFIPAVTGVAPPSPPLRQLLSLPPRLGGLGLLSPLSIAPLQHATSVAVTSELQANIMRQSLLLATDEDTVRNAKLQGRAKLRTLWSDTTATISADLSDHEQRSLEASCDRGASSWLSCLPIAAHGFSLDRRSFQDALAARYGWPVLGIPDTCLCGVPFTTDHAMICFPIIRHTHIRDYIAGLLGRVCNAVETEPVLQPLAGEALPRAANTDPQARLDVKGRGLWSMQEDAFFDIRVFYPCASSYMTKSLSATYRWHEEQKKAAYGERIRRVERGSFSPLVFSSVGGAGGEARNMLKRLAIRLAAATGDSYSILMGRIRCELGFTLVRDSVMMLRGSRRKVNFSHHPSDVLQHESLMPV
eukprot:scpid42792/ scgid5532/ 